MILEAADLTVTLQDADRAFRLLIADFSLAPGQVIGLSGSSGTGKTLLLEVLGLLRRPDPGGRFQTRQDRQVSDLAALWRSGSAARQAPKLRGDLFGFVPQSGGLLPFLTVRENIELSQKISGRLDAGWLQSLEERLGLSPLTRLMPKSLSIGQRQRVAIARALAHRPPFVVADEPTAALDPENAVAAMELLIGAARAGGAGVLVSSHDLSLLDRFPMQRLYLALTSDPGAREVLSELSQRGQVAA